MNKKNEKQNNAKKPVAGKTATGTKKPVRAGKSATGANKGSGRATQPAKRTSEQEKRLSLIERLITALKRERKILKRKNSPVRDEYRYNIDTQHINYVYLVEKDGDKETYHSLGFTHSDTYEGVKNMPLQNNPKKGDSTPSYIRNGEIQGDKKSYSGKKAKNYQLTGDDKANAKSKIRHHKKERRKKVQKKIE